MIATAIFWKYLSGAVFTIQVNRMVIAFLDQEMTGLSTSLRHH